MGANEDAEVMFPSIMSSHEALHKDLDHFPSRCDVRFDEDGLAIFEGQIHPSVCFSSFLGRWLNLNEPRFLRESRKCLLLSHDELQVAKASEW